MQAMVTGILRVSRYVPGFPRVQGSAFPQVVHFHRLGLLADSAIKDDTERVRQGYVQCSYNCNRTWYELNKRNNTTYTYTLKTAYTYMEIVWQAVRC